MKNQQDADAKKTTKTHNKGPAKFESSNAKTMDKQGKKKGHITRPKDLFKPRMATLLVEHIPRLLAEIFKFVA